MPRMGGGLAGSTDMHQGSRCGVGPMCHAGRVRARRCGTCSAYMVGVRVTLNISGPCVGAQVWDLQRGNMDGAVSGRKVGNSDVPNAANDGGFGSIPQALFQIPGTASGARAPQAGGMLRSALLLSGR